MSYIRLRGRWCDIALNIHAPAEDVDDIRDRFYEELEHVFDKFLNNDNGVRVLNFATLKNLTVEDRRRHSSLLDVRSFKVPDCATDHDLVVAKVRERLAMSKQTTHSFHIERFNLKKLNEVESKEQYRVEVSSRFTALENLDTEVDVNKAWETIRENIKISAKERLMLNLLADSHNILNRWKNYFSKLLNVYRVSDVRQTEIYTAEPLVPDPRPFEFERAIAKLKRYKSLGSNQIKLFKQG
ncbi:hypothetical protein B7P43_G02578 [Cryptotermes secundus]|uniref:Endonuclease/exonuclease/phosphatase domain-containing protein n=1 Tax=Cryptotermes secundus TaxID=105785 RepID=A0A2J7R3E0_9NEOP|nr:hypothetical protein B7P43_G02578 [Cryptotermes secundus]